MDAGKSTEQLKLESFKVEGDLTVAFYEGEQGPITTIYGDPTGLRSLASALMTLADLNQQEVPFRNLPVGEGFHLHLFQSRGLTEDSCQLDLGRSDPRIED